MANTLGLLSGVVVSIPNCTVCLESYKEPKVLPTCGHTFCLQCLEKFERDQESREKLNCPQCRKEFEIPGGGLQELPNNYVILQSTQLNQISNQHPSGDMWLGMPVLNCCDEHPSKQIEFYCYDCKMTACIICFKAKHMRHKCDDVNDKGINFHLRIKEEVKKVMPLIVNCRDELIRVEEEKKGLTKHVNMRKAEISRTYDLCRSFLDSDTQLLMYEIKLYLEKTLEELKARKEKLEANLQSLENFKSYCEKMEEKCSKSDEISQEAFQVRSDEIVKIHKEFATTRWISVDVEFLPLSAATRENWIGKLKFNRVVHEKRVGQETENRTFQDLSTSFLEQAGVIQIIPGKGWVYGVAVVGSQVFVAREGATHIQVYDSSDSTTAPFFYYDLKISDKNLSFPRLAACSHHNCLYMIQHGMKAGSLINRVELCSSSITGCWKIEDTSMDLCVTNNYNLLVTLQSGIIQEYTTHFTLVREIILDNSIDNPLHCAQLSDGNFVVSHSGIAQHRVCVVDETGQILVSYGGCKGSGVGHLNWPRHFSVDKYDNLFVADCNNDRVLVLDHSLEYLGDIQTPGHRLKHPHALHLDEEHHSLYIGENSGNVIVINTVDDVVNASEI